jgi:hypothetical protein
MGGSSAITVGGSATFGAASGADTTSGCAGEGGASSLGGPSSGGKSGGGVTGGTTAKGDVSGEAGAGAGGTPSSTSPATKRSDAATAQPFDGFKALCHFAESGISANDSKSFAAQATQFAIAIAGQPGPKAIVVNPASLQARSRSLRSGHHRLPSQGYRPGHRLLGAAIGVMRPSGKTSHGKAEHKNDHRLQSGSTRSSRPLVGGTVYGPR